MNKKELNQIIQDHELWLESDGREGKRAKLKNSNLEGYDLTRSDLRDATFLMTRTFEGIIVEGFSFVEKIVRKDV